MSSDADSLSREAGEKIPEAREDAGNTLRNLLVKMGMEAEVFQEEAADSIRLNIRSKSGALLIGRRGETLDSLEHLLNKISFSGKNPGAKRVFIDVEDYRKKREESIIALAEKLAAKVAESRQPECLRPLNPMERKIVHTFLRDHPDVETKSEGEGLYKKIILSSKAKK